MIRRRVRVYAGCEGDSERSYVRWLQSRFDEAGLALHLDTFIGGGGDPLALVTKCVDECVRRQKLYGPFAARCILLDSDKLGITPGRDQKIRSVLKKGKVDAIYQVFDHEAFLLRHFEGQEAKRPAKGRSMTALKKVWPTYSKPADAKQLSQRLDIDALKRAFGVEKKELSAFLRTLGFKVP